MPDGDRARRGARRRRARARPRPRAGPPAAAGPVAARAPLANLLAHGARCAFPRLDRPAASATCCAGTVAAAPAPVRRTTRSKLLTFLAYADPGAGGEPNPLLDRDRLRPRRPAAGPPIPPRSRRSTSTAGGDPASAGRARPPTSSSSAPARAAASSPPRTCAGPDGRRRPRGRAVGRRADDAPRRADAFDRLYLDHGAHDLGRRDHDPCRAGRRRRDRRELGDVARRARAVRAEWARAARARRVRRAGGRADVEAIERELGVAPARRCPPRTS